MQRKTYNKPNFIMLDLIEDIIQTSGLIGDENGDGNDSDYNEWKA